jgi:hypothetical protein
MNKVVAAEATVSMAGFQESLLLEDAKCTGE